MTSRRRKGIKAFSGSLLYYKNYGFMVQQAIQVMYNKQLIAISI